MIYVVAGNNREFQIFCRARSLVFEGPDRVAIYLHSPEQLRGCRLRPYLDEVAWYGSYYSRSLNERVDILDALRASGWDGRHSPSSETWMEDSSADEAPGMTLAELLGEE